MANALNHANPKNITISLARKKGAVELSVRDDGVGFGYSPLNNYQKKGFGLFSISERVQCLGGALAIETQSGRGTLAQLRIPLKKQRKTKAKAS